jgi:putative tryptophan/tyrosine transport system substrate-binding protein
VRAAMAATKTIPIVMVAGAPLQSGFIKSLYEPGGNVTGLSAMDAELGGKRIQLLSDLIPKLACVGVLATTPTTDPFSRPFVADIQAAGSALNVRVAPVLIGGPSELEEAFSDLAKEGAQAVIVQGFFWTLFKTDCAASDQPSRWVHVGRSQCRGGRRINFDLG